MAYEDGPLCPNCMTGVLEAADDDAGHFLCPLCGAQSQDVVVEQLEEFADVGAPKYRVKGSASRLPQEKPAGTRIDVPRQLMLYVRCMQHMLELQTEVIVGWFGLKAYPGVVKQMWRALIIESQILDDAVMAKRIAKRRGSNAEAAAARRRPHAKRARQAESAEPTDAATMMGPAEQAAGAAGASGPASSSGELSDPGDAEVAGGNTHAPPELAQAILAAKRALPMRTTLLCHLLSAWQLKLPLWASDLLRAVSTGELPYLAFTADTRGVLRGYGEALAPGFLESPALNSEVTLLRHTQQAAHALGLVVPELNLGAFVHRHCAEWGLPEAIAVPAAHLALSRPFDVRSRRMLVSESMWHEPHHRLAALQKAPVLLAIAVVCKHALRQASGVCEADTPPATALREWARRQTRLKALAGLSSDALLHLGSRSPAGFRDMLAFVQKHAFQDEEPSGGLATVVELLRPQACSDDAGPSTSAAAAAAPVDTAQDVRSVDDILARPGEVEGLTHKGVFELLLHVIERELGMPRYVVDRMVTDYEAGLQRIDLAAISAAMGAGLADA